jgi:hypothetical protein
VFAIVVQVGMVAFSFFSFLHPDTLSSEFMRFTPNHLVTDLDIFSSFSACYVSNRLLCAAVSLPIVTEMLFICAADQLVWSTGNYLFIPIRKGGVTWRRGRAGGADR